MVFIKQSLRLENITNRIKLNKGQPIQFANCVAGAVVFVVSAPFLTVSVLPDTDGQEIRNDNLQVTVGNKLKKTILKLKIL